MTNGGCSRLLDGTLSPPGQSRSTGHLRRCPSCREEVEQARTLRHILSLLVRDPMPARAKAALLRAFRLRRASIPPAPRSPLRSAP